MSLDDAFNWLIEVIANGASTIFGLEASDMVISSSLSTAAAGIAQGAGSIALVLTTVYFLLEINMRLVTESGNTPVRTWFGSILKFAIAAYLVGNGGKLTKQFLGLANSLVLSLSENAHFTGFVFLPAEIGGSGSAEAEIYNSFSAVKDVVNDFITTSPAFAFKVLMLLIMVLGVVGTNMVSIIWLYKSIAYKIEFVFRLSMYPFALADAYQGNSSSAVRYLKSIIGMGIYGAAFIIIPKIGLTLMSDLMVNAFDFSDILEGNFNLATGGKMAMNSVFYLVPILKGIAIPLLVPFAEFGTLSLCKQAIKEYLA